MIIINSDIVGIFVIFIIIFLVAREFMTWYWKQNKIVSLLESIDRHLENLTHHIPELERKEEQIESD